MPVSCRAGSVLFVLVLTIEHALSGGVATLPGGTLNWRKRDFGHRA